MSSRAETAPDREELLPTRRSLLDRLRDWEDQASWREFFDTYWKFIYSVALKSGLSDQEAEDVVQETILSVAKKMPEFVYDPARCSFKGWLMHVTRLRIIDQLRRRQPVSRPSPAGDRDSRQTPTVERVPDPASLEPDAGLGRGMGAQPRGRRHGTCQTPRSPRALPDLLSQRREGS